MDIERDFLPRLLFFKDLKLEPQQISRLFNINPFLFTEPLELIQERVEYFQSKKFEDSCICDVIVTTPRVLTTPVKMLDKHLGFLQAEFKLNGDEVRFVLSKASKLFDVSKNEIKASAVIKSLIKLYITGNTPCDVKKYYIFDQLCRHSIFMTFFLDIFR